MIGKVGRREQLEVALSITPPICYYFFVIKTAGIGPYMIIQCASICLENFQWLLLWTEAVRSLCEKRNFGSQALHRIYNNQPIT